MKVTFNVEVTVDLPDGTNADDVTFKIDPTNIVPMVEGVEVGKAITYTTTDHFDDAAWVPQS